MIPWLETDTPFPSLDQALEEPNGLLAAGGDLSPERLLAAYHQGIFPWFSSGQPILWWSPDPRMVLFPEALRITRSLAKTLRQGQYEVRLDHDFPAVIRACATTPRPGQDGTWITRTIAAAYTRLHELGVAHCVETWVDGVLVGGLYGVGLGRMFYGESMFSHRTDASKIAFAHLVSYLGERGYGMIDCQMKTKHLASLGAREIPRQSFIQRLQTLTEMPMDTGRWPVMGANHLWRRP